MIVVYIAGPFRAELPTGRSDHWQVHRNVCAALDRALAVWALGAVALCPHGNTMFFQDASGVKDQVWLEGDLELLRRCDAVLTTDDWQRSKGACAEVDAARAWNLPIFHTVEALGAWLKERPSRALVVGTRGGETPR